MRPLNFIFRLAARGTRGTQTYQRVAIRRRYQITYPKCSHHPFGPAGRPRTNHSSVQSISARRHESNTSVSSSSPGPRRAEGNHNAPAFEMTFTCKRCQTRSTHRVTKQGYFHGTVLITCSGCKNRHLISDHLGIFSDKAVTLEDLMREKGHMIKKGTLSEEGDVEFWDDGTTKRRLELGIEKVVEEEVKARAAAAAARVENEKAPGSSFKGDEQ